MVIGEAQRNAIRGNGRGGARYASLLNFASSGPGNSLKTRREPFLQCTWVRFTSQQRMKCSRVFRL